MPTAHNVDNGSEINQPPYRSHDDRTGRGTQQHHSSYSHNTQTTTVKHRSSSQSPREGSDGRAKHSDALPTKEHGSSSARVLSLSKGTATESPLINDRTEDVRSDSDSGQRKRAASISETYFKVDKKQVLSDNNGGRSSRAEETPSISRDARSTEHQLSYAQSVTQQGGPNTKHPGNSGNNASVVPSETKPSRAESPTKRNTSQLPRDPTDTRYASRAPPTGHSSYPPQTKSKLVVSEEGQGGRKLNDGSSSSEVEASTRGVSEILGQEVGPTQQPRSQQQQQQQQQPQPQEDWRWGPGKMLRNAFGGQPKDKALLDAEYRINNLEADLSRERMEHRHRKQRCHDLEHEISRLKEHNQSLQHELYNSQRELQEAKSLSDIRGKELMGAQVFLTKADSLSMSDVIEKVGILNEEIFQAAALFAEGLRHEKRDNIPMNAIQQCHDQTVLALGKQMTQLLIEEGNRSEIKSEVNPLLGQAVISSCIVSFCSLKLDLWFPSEPNISNFLSHVYSQIRQSEEQAVSGRWRSLIRAQIRPSTENWKRELFGLLENLLVVSSWDAPNDVKQVFDSKVWPIFKALEDLRIAIYEKVTSVDLHAFIPEPFGPFESWMEDAYADGRNAQRNVEGTDTVAGTTALGLKRARVGREERFKVILPPKVVLVSTLKEALQPSPPTKGRSKKRVEPQAQVQDGTSPS